MSPRHTTKGDSDELVVMDRLAAAVFLLGLFLNAIKNMKQLEKQLPKYKDKIREVKDDEDD